MVDAMDYTVEEDRREGTVWELEEAKLQVVCGGEYVFRVGPVEIVMFDAVPEADVVEGVWVGG